MTSNVDQAAAERAAKRAKKTSVNRRAYFAEEIAGADTARHRLQHACRYALAVGAGMDDAGRDVLTAAVITAIETTERDHHV